MRRLLALAKKELLQLRRDRMTLAMTFMLPLVQILLFGVFHLLALQSAMPEQEQEPAQLGGEEVAHA